MSEHQHQHVWSWRRKKCAECGSPLECCTGPLVRFLDGDGPTNEEWEEYNYVPVGLVSGLGPVPEGAIRIEEVKSRDELVLNFGSMKEHPKHLSRCPSCGVWFTGEKRDYFNHSLGAWDALLSEVVENERAIYVPPTTIKRLIALHWLGMPQGFWQKLAWAWSLLFGA